MNRLFGFLLYLIEFAIVALPIWGLWRHPFITVAVLLVLVPLWLAGYADILLHGEIVWDD